MSEGNDQISSAPRPEDRKWILVDPGVTERKCKTCGDVKPIEDFNWRTQSRTHKKNRAQSCKKCDQKAAKAREEADPEKKKKRNAKQKEWLDKNPLNNAVHQAKDRAKNIAKERGIDWKAGGPDWDALFNIDVDYLKKLYHDQGGVCKATKLPFIYEGAAKRTRPFVPSIDRIDPAKGYVKGNVRLVLWAINQALNEFGLDLFLRGIL